MMLGTASAASAQTPAHWRLAPVGSSVSAGHAFAVDLTLTIDDGWHVYAISTPAGGPRALEIRVAKGSPFVLAGAIASTEPTTSFDPNFNMDTRFHEGRASFHIPLGVATGAPGGRQQLTLALSYQVCNARLCLPPAEEDVSTTATIAHPGMDPPRLAPRLESPATPDRARPAPVASPPAPTDRGSAVIDMSATTSTASSLGAYLGLAALMGALSLLTPCVFPMVPITVSYFLGLRSADGDLNRRRAISQAFIYGLGIVLTFTAVGFAIAIGFGASGLNRFAADPWLNLGITALFTGFALSLFGVVDLRLPSRLLTSASTAGGAGRGAGATMLMALAFTLTSFTCTAPFLGTLLVVASQGAWQWPLAGMLVFSTVFALPFVALAVVPHAVASLPRSGAWLLATKVTMGLLEIAAAMKFLSNVDLVWSWHVVTRTVVLVSWIAIAVVIVAYLIGALRIGPAPRLGRPGVVRVSLSAAAVALGLWLGTGLGGRGLGELEAFLPPADLAGSPANGELPWIVNDYDAALAQARAANRPLLIDFTGYTCTNCRWMEANMFPRPDVTRELARYVRVRLYTDGQGEKYQGYQQLERDRFGTVALPYYAALSPDGRPTVVFAGLTRAPEQFVAFLEKGRQP
jgi:thiol:disulfide interchange protein DsbD